MLTEEQSTTVLLETMSGKGSEVGATFQELREIIDRVEKKDKLGVCLDTCHVWDGGYDIVHDLDGVLHEFDQVIGLSRLKAVHLNDSMNGLGSHKDRHAKIGEGEIGLDALVNVVCHPRFLIPLQARSTLPSLWMIFNMQGTGNIPHRCFWQPSQML